MPDEEGQVWLNPNDLPGGCQVTVWHWDDDGNPNDAPISLDVPAHHNELTRAEATRLGRALTAAADEGAHRA